LHFHDDPARNTVWMSTDRGLAALNRTTQQIRLYTERDGMANSFVYCVLTDSNNNLWMSTNRGITRFDVNNANFKNFGLSEGLQGLEFNGNAYLRSRQGVLYFGGINGFNFYTTVPAPTRRYISTTCASTKNSLWVKALSAN
jgi:streptogramin lyase